MLDFTTLAGLIVVSYLLGGMVKGVVGLGLPTIAIGILSLTVSPAFAAAIMVIPSFTTNFWQMLAGPYFRSLLRRLWPLLVAMAVAPWATAGILTGDDSSHAQLALGCVLVAYALLGLSGRQFSVPRAQEWWLTPVIGLGAGAMIGITGVFLIPAIPYIAALRLERDEMVQAIGIVFMTGTVALCVVLTAYGQFKLDQIGLSLLAVPPSIAGLVLGRRIRNVISPELFRKLFFGVILILGVSLIGRTL